MNVCVLIPFFDAYKGGNHLPLLQETSDVQFTILTNRTKPSHPELPLNVSVLELQKRIGPFYYGVADILFAKAVLRRYPPSHKFWQQFDVIHLNQTLGYGLAHLQKTGKPLLYTIHHPVTVDYAIALQESTSMMQKIQWTLKYTLLIRAQRKLCKTLPTIMTVSETVKKRLQDDYHISPDKITVIPNGVDGSVFTRSDTVEHDIVAVGSFIHPRKGFAYLVEVYTALSEKGYTIADVGRRTDEQRTELEKIDNVTIHNVVEADRLVSLIQHSQCLISTSLYEGFGLSLIEALACGKPAFAFDVGAVREVLEPIDPSLILPARDTQAFARRVEEFLMSPDTQKQGKQLLYREEVLRRYSMDKAAKSLLALYTTLTS